MIINTFEDMHQYRFAGKDDSLGLNIYCYIKNNEAIMFDSGYEHHFLEVKKHLDDKGVKLTKLILTHFHPDHIGGILHCKDIEIIGSVYAEDTLKLFYDNYAEFLPSTVVAEEMSLDFHGTKIVMEPNPSHSKCTMLIKLGEFVFAADDVMFFDDDTQCMPYCAIDVESHLEGLKKLRELSEGYMILPNHGRALKCTLYFKFAIMYLSHILKFPKQTYEEFSKLYKIEFKNNKWHNINTSKVLNKHE